MRTIPYSISGQILHLSIHRFKYDGKMKLFTLDLHLWGFDDWLLRSFARDVEKIIIFNGNTDKEVAFDFYTCLSYNKEKDQYTTTDHYSYDKDGRDHGVISANIDEIWFISNHEKFKDDDALYIKVIR